MQGGGRAGVLPVLQASDNAVDAVPCEQIPLVGYAAYRMAGNLRILYFGILGSCP